jgi:hypothetical protein
MKGSGRRRWTGKHQTYQRPTVEPLPELRLAALPPAPSLQVAVALVLYSITRDPSHSGSSS